MSSTPKVKVSIYRDDEIIHDENTVYYNCPPKHKANVQYHKFISSIYKRMGINSTIII